MQFGIADWNNDASVVQQSSRCDRPVTFKNEFMSSSDKKLTPSLIRKKKLVTVFFTFKNVSQK